jgi:undecaprenyl diphosphate synthase
MHVAIIMDGNGRWATQRGLPRTAGHRAGARAVRNIVEAAIRARVDTLTLYAFSADNWTRPRREVDSLMQLLKQYLHSEAAKCVEQNIRVSVIGRRDRLNAALVRLIEHTEAVTRHCTRLSLQLAIDYSARDVIRRACIAMAGELAAKTNICDLDPADAFSAQIARAMGAERCADVDLLIRTGGEKRLSDFLLWETAYAELVFVERGWPEFTDEDFAAALSEYYRRERRFGTLAAATATTEETA